MTLLELAAKYEDQAVCLVQGVESLMSNPAERRHPGVEYHCARDETRAAEYFTIAAGLRARAAQESE